MERPARATSNRVRGVSACVLVAGAPRCVGRRRSKTPTRRLSATARCRSAAPRPRRATSGRGRARGTARRRCAPERVAHLGTVERHPHRRVMHVVVVGDVVRSRETVDVSPGPADRMGCHSRPWQRRYRVRTRDSSRHLRKDSREASKPWGKLRAFPRCADGVESCERIRAQGDVRRANVPSRCAIDRVPGDQQGVRAWASSHASPTCAGVESISVATSTTTGCRDVGETGER